MECGNYPMSNTTYPLSRLQIAHNIVQTNYNVPIICLYIKLKFRRALNSMHIIIGVHLCEQYDD